MSRRSTIHNKAGTENILGKVCLFPYENEIYDNIYEIWTELMYVSGVPTIFFIIFETKGKFPTKFYNHNLFVSALT